MVNIYQSIFRTSNYCKNINNSYVKKKYIYTIHNNKQLCKKTKIYIYIYYYKKQYIESGALWSCYHRRN